MITSARMWRYLRYLDRGGETALKYDLFWFNKMLYIKNRVPIGNNNNINSVIIIILLYFHRIFLNNKVLNPEFINRDS